MTYKEMSKEILDLIGGNSNIERVGYCATRLRINIKDMSKVNKESLAVIDGVRGLIQQENQLQLIVGTKVDEAYNDFIEVAGYKEDEKSGSMEDETIDTIHTNKKEPQDKNFKYYISTAGGFFAEIFMPIVPALITGGVILAINNLLVNYFNFAPESGTARIILAIFGAAFGMLPIYLGFTVARKLRLSPILGAFLGAILVSPDISGVGGLDFLGIPITEVEYGGSIIPIVLGVIFMYYVDKVLGKIIPEFVTYLLKPLLTMLIVVPAVLIVFGPLGTWASDYVGSGILWLMDTAGFIAIPILSALYPYMVMLGIDKAIMPIGFQAVESLGFDPITMVIGYISNLAVGASALAVGRQIANEKEKGGIYSYGMTGLFGITEPAFYGALIGKPKALVGTAIGALSAGLFAGIFSLKSFVMGGAPGLFTLLFFLNPDGTLNNIVIALVTGAISIIVSFLATTFILQMDNKKSNQN